MTLVAKHSRSSGAPGLVEPPILPVPRRVVSGDHDVFLPVERLRPAVRRTLGVDLEILAGAGHLVVDEEPEVLAELVEAVAIGTMD